MRDVVDLLESRVQAVQRILIFQDVKGSLYAFNWLQGLFYWARPHRPPPYQGEPNTSFSYPSPLHSSSSGTLSTYFDSACPLSSTPESGGLTDAQDLADIRQRTGRLLPSPDGGLTFIDSAGEFVPVPHLSVMNVLHQTPFTSPLFPSHYLLGKQTQQVVTINLEDGQDEHINPELPPLELATNTVTISAVPVAAQTAVDWSFSLTSIGSVGESPTRPSETECLLASSSTSENAVEVCLPSRGWAVDTAQNLFANACSEVLVESALKGAVYAERNHVTLDLCAVAKSLVGHSFCSDGIVEIKFPADILNVFPLKTLHNGSKGLTLGEGLLAIEPGTFPVNAELYSAVLKNLQVCAVRLASEGGVEFPSPYAISDSSEDASNETVMPEIVARLVSSGSRDHSLEHKQRAVRALLTSRPTEAPPSTIEIPKVTAWPPGMPSLAGANWLQLPPAPNIPGGDSGGFMPNGLYVAVLSPSLSNWIITAVFAAIVFGVIGWWMGRQQKINGLPREVGAHSPSAGEQKGSRSTAASPATSVQHQKTVSPSLTVQQSSMPTHLSCPESLVPPDSPLRQMLDNGRFSKTFKNAELVGRGGFGSVFRALHKLEPGHTPYALKVVFCEASTLGGDLSGARYFREVATNRDILSKYVVRYFTWWCEEPQFLPIFDDSILPLGAIPPSPVAKDWNEASLFASRREMDSSSSRLIPKGRSQPCREGCDNDWSSDSEGICFERGSQEICDEVTREQSKRTPLKPAEVKKREESVANAVCHICLIIQMEWCPGKTLRNWLNQPSRERPVLLDDCSNRLELNYFKHMMKGLRDIHAQGIVHRDVKPENIFVEGTKLKIGDFGLSKMIRGGAMTREVSRLELAASMNAGGDQSTTGMMIGTPSYAAPEVGQRQCNEKADIYSCGLILLELLAERTRTIHERHTLLYRFRQDGCLPAYFNDAPAFRAWTAVLRAMCHEDPEMRPSAETIIEVLKSVPSNKLNDLRENEVRRVFFNGGSTAR